MSGQHYEGWNPVTGRDSTGQRPSYTPYGMSVPAQGQAYIPDVGPAPGYFFTGTGVFTTGQPGVNTYCLQPCPAAAAAAATTPGVTIAPGAATDGDAHPGEDDQMPAAHMTNSTGGRGCEPGYNYFFPRETTKVHVFHSETAPWQLPPQTQLPYRASHVPCDTTMASLLRGFGCDNPNPRKNRVYELVSCGNGRWYKGVCVDGKNKDMLEKTMSDMGWDASRTGNSGEKPVVCLWFCKG